METIKEYLLSVISAAIICSIVRTLLENRGTLTNIIKLLTGIFMAIIVIAPVKKIEIPQLFCWTDIITVDANEAVESGTQTAQKEMVRIIKERTEAYILEKASSLNAELSADVSVSAELPLVPISVTVTGSASPYAKSVLQRYIAEELGIGQEDQIWM